jgi:hypothetical protein
VIRGTRSRDARLDFGGVEPDLDLDACAFEVMTLFSLATQKPDNEVKT